MKNKNKYKALQKIQKRDGQIVPFDEKHIFRAIWKAMDISKEGGEAEADLVMYKVLDALLVLKKEKNEKVFVPTVEKIQDVVENELIASNFIQTGKAYILYRKNRAQVREQVGFIPEKVKELVTESKKYFRNPLAELVYYRTYAKWIPEEGRRETWIETIDRYVDFMRENLGSKLTATEYNEIREAILNQEVMPSMRLLQFAGKAARKTNICAYNCSFIAPKSFQDFGEIMYISMCGTGVGWSVESENIQALPQIKKQNGKILPTHVVADSKEGWADAFILGLKTWFEGNDISFDYSLVRPAGSILKTMGGKSSGPDPLRSLIDFSRERILRRQGRHLTNLDAHDIICKIGECVVAGGVRRSAMISLSDLDDENIRDSKKGQFYNTEAQRMLANNSAVYNMKPSTSEFLEEWTALMKSGSGERGIFNRGGLAKTLPKRRLKQFSNGEFPAWGTNPCGEIILQSKQFCNLSEVVARADDTEESLLRKIRIATILGTYQSSLTYFPYLSKEWKKNCEKERLLGVSITGQWDSKVARDPAVLRKLRDASIEANKKYSKRFLVAASTCITCVKPSGNASQTVDCSSGMHARHAPYYIRRVRISASDALFKMLKDQGVPYYPEVGQTLEDATTFVLEFPVKAPEGAIFKNDLSALDQLEHWKVVKENYTEHNPSVTISIGDDEWLHVANWIYENWELVGGLSFLPRSNHVYQLAPYEEIKKDRYEEMLKKVKDLDFSKIVTYEKVDETETKKELACVAGICEV
ncbi:MAG: ribonucleoside-triphosphate reductase [Candidatus Pacebacteria bacterium]|nr:ribonucleoside-triphosphate reductase [Candidatus Paceibacterota bacterium]